MADLMTGRVKHTDRINRLYSRLQDRMTHGQKKWGHDQSGLEPEHRGLALVLRRAHALEKTLTGMPIVIEDDDIVVGNTMRSGMILRTSLFSYMTEEERTIAEETGATVGEQLSHKTPSYYDVLEKGLGGIIAEIDQRLQTADGGPRIFYQACRQECMAVIRLANRYAALAEQKAFETPSEDRREELLTIAQICRRVPEQPAVTFQEAVQSFWFVHYALFSTGTKLSCGRLDQYLYPCLGKDLAEGSISLERAQELVDALWLRFNDRAQIERENFYVSEENAREDDFVVVQKDAFGSAAAGHRRRPSTTADSADAINHFGQNILLSGIRPDGSDGTNTLTYLCLNTMERLPLTQPVVTVRLHRHSPAPLVRRVAEVLKTGGGMPYVNNDEVIIPAYIGLGVTPEDARDYANSNCWETLIEGRSDQELIRGINFLLFLELSLRRGVSPIHGSIGPDTGDPCEFESFENLMSAWRTQLDHQLRLSVDHIGKGIETGTLEHSSHGRFRHNPLLSSLTRDCLEKGLDVIKGGARYQIWHVMGEAVSNAVNAAAALKKLVFEEKTVAMEEIVQAMEVDWEGHENLRRRLMARAPQFSNDDDYADEIGRQMMDYFLQRVRHHSARYPSVLFPPSVGTFSWYALIGKELGATPDGRHAREAIAANFSPVAGTDVSGPTAAINSYLKVGVEELAAGAPIDLRFSSSGLKGESGTDRLAALIGTFIHLGGNMLTITVTDVEELKAAMERPEDYRHLRVRMGGWSAYFVMLGKEQQQIHISRVEHGLG